MRYTSAIKGNQIRRDRELTIDELRHYVPSVFSNEAHESRSSRFAPVSTWEVLQALKSEAGYFPVMASQSRTRDLTKKDFTKHMIRLRTDRKSYSTDLADEIIIVNANDGTSAYKLLSGQFRFVCANGLIFGDINNNKTVRHSGDARREVLEGVYEIIKDYDEIHDIQDRMKALTLTPDQRRQYAYAAYMAKHGLPENNVLDYNPMLLLQAARYEDNGHDLFSTFNVAQENLINGGVAHLAVNNKGKIRKKVSNPINGIDQNIKVNRSLWESAKDAMKEFTIKQY